METIQASQTQSKIKKIKGHFLFGNTFDFLKDPIHFVMSAMQSGERMVQIRLVLQDCYLVFHADDVKHILQENNKNYTKSEAYQMLELFLGNGLLTSEGNFWKRQRKLAQPAFHKQRLVLLVDRMNQLTLGTLQRWEKQGMTGNPINISEEMMKLTLEIVSESLFSADIKKHLDNISSSLTTIIEYAYENMGNYINIPLKYPTPRNIRFKRAVNHAEQIIYDIIESRKNAKVGEHDDLLGMLMEAQDEETGEKMDPKQLRDEVTTIFMAGHETTANAMAWTFYLLAQHPEVVQKLKREVYGVLGQNGLPTYENTRDLKYTLQVIQESMRLYPPAWLLGRKSIGSDQVGQYAIKSGSPILISSYAMHRNPAYWNNPNDFNPENFLPELEKKRPTYAYFPFGGGPRMCIGSNFALMEMQIILALTIRKFGFELIEGVEVKPEPIITLRPKNGLKLRLVSSS